MAKFKKRHWKAVACALRDSAADRLLPLSSPADYAAYAFCAMFEADNPKFDGVEFWDEYMRQERSEARMADEYKR